MNLRYKVLVGYFILIVLIGFMASILVRERHRISEIDLQNSEVQQAIRDIHNVHRYITRLTMLGESVIDWKMSLIGTEQTVVITVSNVCVQIVCCKH